MSQAHVPIAFFFLQFFQYEVMKPIRSITGPSVPIYAWQSASVSGCICLFGPEKLDGLGDLAKTLETITEADEKARFDEAQRVCVPKCYPNPLVEL